MSSRTRERSLSQSYGAKIGTFSHVRVVLESHDRCDIEQIYCLDRALRSPRRPDVYRFQVQQAFEAYIKDLVRAFRQALISE